MKPTTLRMPPSTAIGNAAQPSTGIQQTREPDNPHHQARDAQWIGSSLYGHV